MKRVWLSCRRQVVVGVCALAGRATGCWGNPQAAARSPSPVAPAAPSRDVEAEFDKLQSRLRRPESLSVNFTHERYNALRKRRIIQTGEAQFIQPGLFRWAYTDPEKLEYRYDGKVLTEYQPDQKYATQYSAQRLEAKEISAIVDLVLSPQVFVKTYRVTAITSSEGRTVVDLVPRQSDRLESLTLVVLAGADVLHQVVMTFAGGNAVTMTLSGHSFKPLSRDFLNLPPQTRVEKS